MVGQKIILTLTEPVFERLMYEKKKYAYSSIQEIINEVLRDKFFRENILRNKSGRGRPKKPNEAKLITRQDKIFSKDGARVEV